MQARRSKTLRQIAKLVANNLENDKHLVYAKLKRNLRNTNQQAAVVSSVYTLKSMSSRQGITKCTRQYITVNIRRLEKNMLNVQRHFDVVGDHQS